MEQGAAYVAFIEAALKAEHDRRTSLDARGLAVVTTSGTLVTIVSAVAALAAGREGIRVTGLALIPLALALIGFSAGAVLGLVGAMNRYYTVADTESLTAMTKDRWTDSGVNSTKGIARSNIKTIRTLRDGNAKKATMVVWALWAEIVGLVALSVTVVVAALSLV